METNEAGPGNGTQVKLWIANDVLAWIDAEAVAKDRKRSWIINQALRDRMTRLERRRERGAKRRGRIE